MTNSYATLAEFKAAFFSATDTTDDIDIQDKIQAASRAIDNDLGRRFWTTAADETRIFTTVDGVVYPDDLLSITTLKTDGDGDKVFEDTWTADDYDLSPINAPLDNRPYIQIDEAISGDYSFPSSRNGIQIVGKFGFCATGNHPDTIKQACLIQANRWYQRKKAPFGVTAPNEFGQSVVLNVLDADVSHMLDPYRKELL